jgi:hypothetical protein
MLSFGIFLYLILRTKKKNFVIVVFTWNYSDMSASTETSGIAEFFKRKSIFITGATGFIGKQLVEKLVRSCPGRKYKIFFLVL